MTENDTQPKKSNRGILVVGAIVLLGIAGMVTARSWYAMQERALRSDDSAAETAAFDEDKAIDELDALGQVFQEAVAENQDVRSMVGPAEQLAARYAEYAPAHTLLAQVYRVAGRIDDSIHALDRSLELDPEQANVHEMAGQMELSQERFDNALAHFSQAAGMEPRETKYQLFIAQVYIVQQQYDQARQLLLRALALDSSQHKAYAMLSDLYARQNKTDLALDQMQKAIDHTSISERDMQVVYIRNKSRLLRRANKPSDALLALEALSAEESADMAVVEEIATCWAMMGEFATAAEIYEEGFFHNHNDFELLERAAAWRIKAGDTDRAAKYLEIIRRNDPRSPAIADLEEQLAEPRTR